MVWGCMGWNGVGQFAEIEGKMDADQFVSILEDHLLPSLEESGIPEEQVIFFQQVNDPKQKSKRAKNQMENNNITLLDWPAQSLDLNPIEHLWDHAKKRLKEYPTPSKGVWQILAVLRLMGAIPSTRIATYYFSATLSQN